VKTIYTMAIGILVVGALTGLTSRCGEQVEYEGQPQSEAEAHTEGAEAAAAAAATPAAGPAGVFSGVVTETMNAGSYTYVLVDTDAGQRWAAGSEMSVNVGDRVTIADAILMRDFASSSLDRTFDEIWFAQTIHVGDTPAPAATGGGFDQSRGIGSAHVGVDQEIVVDIVVPAGGRTVAALYAEKESLAGHEVVVRGQVVKYTAEVMGSNWLHIQDGSGEGETADLTVTTAAQVEVGDVVVVRGKLAIDRDFGYGYRYALLIEDAEVTVE